MILKATYYCYLMRRFLYHFTFACYDVMVLDFLYLCEINLHIYIYITMYILCILPNFIAILLLVLNRISIFQLFPFDVPTTYQYSHVLGDGITSFISRIIPVKFGAHTIWPINSGGE